MRSDGNLVTTRKVQPCPSEAFHRMAQAAQRTLGSAFPRESLPAWRRRLAERGIPIESSFTWPTVRYEHLFP